MRRAVRSVGFALLVARRPSSGSPTLTVRQAALATGLSPKALRRRIERGTLRSELVGGLRHVAVSELLASGLLVHEPAGGPEPRAGYPVGHLTRAHVEQLLNRIERQAAEISELRRAFANLQEELEGERALRQ